MKSTPNNFKKTILATVLTAVSFTPAVQAENLCNTGTEAFVLSYHSSIVATTDNFYAFGETIAADGASHHLVPASITPASGYDYLGDPLFSTAGTHDTQAFLLTTEAFYVWGASGDNAGNETAISTVIDFHSTPLPVGVAPSNVTLLTMTNGGVFLVANGKIYVQGVAVELHGDNTGATDANAWHTVKKSTGGDLINVEKLKVHSDGAFAMTSEGKYYTWGSSVFLGDGNGSQTLNSAKEIIVPFAGLASAIAVTGFNGDPGLSLYALNSIDTKIYVLGGNSNGQLGLGTKENSLYWNTVKKSDGVDLIGVKDLNAQDNTDHHPTAGAIVDNYDGNNDVFLVWGKNSSSALGSGNPSTIKFPSIPTGFTPGTDVANKIEMGGHATMYYDRAVGKMCYMGHRIKGSMGDGSAADETEGSLNCVDTPDIANLCAGEVPPVATNDTKLDQPHGAVTLNVITDDNGSGLDADADGTINVGTVDLDPSTPNIIDTTFNVQGEGRWAVDPATGLVTFTPDDGFVNNPTDIKYTVQDNNGNISNRATIHITYLPLVAKAAISGKVVDPSGAPVVGAVVSIVGANGNIINDTEGNPLSVTVNQVDGSYNFTSVPPGDYIIKETNPAYYVSTNEVSDQTNDPANLSMTDDQIPVTVIDAEVDSGNDFIDTGIGSISGSVKDPEGNPVVDATITLIDSSGNTVKDINGNLLTVTVNPNDGSYLFNNVPAGSYRIKETNPVGYTSTNENSDQNGDSENTSITDDIIPVTLTKGETDSGNDFIDKADPTVGTITGRVIDPEGNTVVGAIVTLVDGNENTINDIHGNSLTITVNPTDGSYSFNDVPAGSYVLKETNSAGYISVNERSDQTNDPANTNVIDDQIPVTIVGGETDSGNDFVDKVEVVDPVFGTIGGSVKDPTGNSITGAIVTLVDGEGKTVKDINGNSLTMTVDPTDGSYTFNSVPPGNYFIKETNPVGYTSVDENSDQNGDSDNSNTTDDLIAVTIVAGEKDIDNNFVDNPPVIGTAGKPIPTLSEWGQIILMLLVAGMAMVQTGRAKEDELK